MCFVSYLLEELLKGRRVGYIYSAFLESTLSIEVLLFWRVGRGWSDEGRGEKDIKCWDEWSVVVLKGEWGGFGGMGMGIGVGVFLFFEEVSIARETGECCWRLWDWWLWNVLSDFMRYGMMSGKIGMVRYTESIVFSWNWTEYDLWS